MSPDSRVNLKNTGIRVTGNNFLNNFLLETANALLFINGEPPQSFPNPDDFDITGCTDGAFHYLKNNGFPLKKLDFISGDFDSHSGADVEVFQERFIHTPDQDRTDFDKALEILLQKNVRKVTVLGGSGGEMDHFLGNLTVAYKFREELDIRFYDAFSMYFFIPKHFSISGVREKMISLYPFPNAGGIVTKGLNWPLENEELDIRNRIGTRNFAIDNEVSVTYRSGDLLFFVGQKYR